MFRCGTALRVSLVLAALSFAAFPAAAHAQLHGGVRGGVSVDPEQAYVGAHVETAPLVDRLRFRPNVEVGFGNDVTLTSINLEFTYAFASRRPWHSYAGAGPAINFASANGNSDTAAGFNFLFGVERRDGLFFEGKLGVGDSPTLKFGVGYTFR